MAAVQGSGLSEKQAKVREAASWAEGDKNRVEASFRGSGDALSAERFFGFEWNSSVERLFGFE